MARRAPTFSPYTFSHAYPYRRRGAQPYALTIRHRIIIDFVHRPCARRHGLVAIGTKAALAQLVHHYGDSHCNQYKPIKVIAEIEAAVGGVLQESANDVSEDRPRAADDLEA